VFDLGNQLIVYKLTQGGPGSEGQGAFAPEAESLLAFKRPIKVGKFTPFTVSSKLRVYDV